MADERTPNQQLLDSQILWQVLLLRYSLHVRARVLTILNGTEIDVASQIRGALALEPGFRDQTKAAELERLVRRLELTRRQAWDQAELVVDNSLKGLAEVELERQNELYAAWLPGVSKPLWLLAGVSALAAPFQGRTIAKWLRDAAADDSKRIRNAVFAGAGIGRTPGQIARTVVGTARVRGVDGVTQTSRNYIDSILTTGVIHTSAQIRDQFFRLNAQVLPLEQFLAVLDGRTTRECRGFNGNRYPVGTGPMPPIHMRCRSARYAVLPRQVGGPIPEPEVYEAWLRRQSWAVQLELLGATRARRLRMSTLDVGAFTDYGARELALDDLLPMARRLQGAEI